MNPTEIARSLTEAQRRNIENTWCGPRGWRVPNASEPLQRMGLTNGVRLTPLGLAVRAELERMNEHD